jgi:hypothetical protein
MGVLRLSFSHEVGLSDNGRMGSMGSPLHSAQIA